MQRNTYKNKIIFLGSGTSSGVPTIGCECKVCTSDDIKDKRLRTSVFIETADTKILIDLTPDFRQQMLNYNINDIDLVLLTHHHFDHIGGFDDIRAFNYKYRKAIPIYAQKTTIEKLKKTFFYAFEKPEQLGGGIPIVDLIKIDDRKDIMINDTQIQPISLLHGNMNVLGFRIDDLAYCTDVNKIPKESYKKLKNLDILIIDALRYHKHSTHFNIEEALEEIEKIKPNKAYLIHIAHQIKHSDCQEKLPENIFIAYDGLTLEF